MRELFQLFKSKRQQLLWKEAAILEAGWRLYLCVRTDENYAYK